MTIQQSKKAIIVLSPGRSGTSLLMQVLGALGMSLSENMVPGNFSNPDGHFEDKDIMDLHIRLFSEIGGHPYLPPPEGWLQHPSVKPIIHQLTEIFRDHISRSSSIWGFKDPRTNAFLPLWFRILNPEKVTPSFIFSTRKPKSTIASYIKQYNNPPHQAELAWLTRTTDALHHTAADCFIVHYEDWFTRPTEVANGLLTYTGLDEYFTGNVEDALKDVIKPNLNRAVYEDYEVKNEYVLKLYDVLKDCRGADFDRARLMAVVKECRKAMDGFKGWYMEAQKFLGQLNEVRTTLQTSRQTLQETKKRLAAAQAENTRLKQQIEEAAAGKPAGKNKPAPQKPTPAPPTHVRITATPGLELVMRLGMEIVGLCREMGAGGDGGRKKGTESWTGERSGSHLVVGEPGKGVEVCEPVGDDSQGAGPVALLVVGAPRSGVGLMGECLAACGARVVGGDGEFLGGRGCALAGDVRELLRGDGDDFGPRPAEWRYGAAAGQAGALIQKQLDNLDEGLIVLADPRLHRAFPVWQEACAALGRNVRVVHVVRHPWEVVSSLAEHGGLDPHQAGLVWLTSVRDILVMSTGTPLSLITLARIQADPVAALYAALAPLGLFQRLAPGRAVNKLLSLVQPSIQHHHAATVNLPDQEVFTLHQRVFQELQLLMAMQGIRQEGGLHPLIFLGQNHHPSVAGKTQKNEYRLELEAVAGT